jgi:release factor glutamine methyltransferase
MKVFEVLKYCERFLKNCGIETYKSDCIFLIAHLLDIHPSLIPLKEKEEFKNFERLEKILEKRCKERISVPHLIGEWDCLGRTFKVFPKVLSPRPATELLIETVIGEIEERFPEKEALKGLEVGTGTGCISINLLLEFPNLKMVGIEIDPVAVKNTSENVKRYKVENRLTLVEGDIFKLCPSELEKFGKFHFMVSNPPYIAERDREKLPPELNHENPIALFGGQLGTKFHEFFAENCKSILLPNGFLALEFEPFQKPILEEVFKKQGWKVAFVEDFAGNPRVLIASVS